MEVNLLPWKFPWKRFTFMEISIEVGGPWKCMEVSAAGVEVEASIAFIDRSFHEYIQ